MTAKEMLGKVDHTQLKAFATWEDIQKLCDPISYRQCMCTSLLY